MRENKVRNVLGRGGFERKSHTLIWWRTRSVLRPLGEGYAHLAENRGAEGPIPFSPLLKVRNTLGISSGETRNESGADGLGWPG